MHKSVPPCVNHQSSTDLMRAVAGDILGSDAVATTEQSLGGEDFAWILAETPGSLARLGVRNPESEEIGDLHRGTMDIDEAAIALGVRLLAGLAVDVRR